MSFCYGDLSLVYSLFLNFIYLLFYLFIYLFIISIIFLYSFLCIKKKIQLWRFFTSSVSCSF